MVGSSGTGPRGASNGQPGAKAAAGDDLARAERFLSPGGADPDAVSGTVDLNPAVVRTTSWCDRTSQKTERPWRLERRRGRKSRGGDRRYRDGGARIAQWYVVEGRTSQPAPKNAVCRLRRQLRAGRDLNGPTRRAGAWVGAGAAPDFRYPPYDINALAFSSPAHSIRWAVKVSRATAPGFGSYVGV